MGCLGLLLPLLIILPLLIVLLLFNIVAISYGELGLSQTTAIALLIATLVGGMINIPISRRQIEYQEPQTLFSQFFFYTPPRVATQTIAVNLGGAVIPVGFAIYLMPRAPWLPTLISTLAVIIVARLLSRPVPGMGIVMPAFIPPIVSAGLAFLLARSHPAPVAFISGTLGTLIGADLLNWPNFKKLGSHVISIGGAGIFDGVFLAGILAVLISSL
jgi:uncharacterized membrane protein